MFKSTVSGAATALAQKHPLGVLKNKLIIHMSFRVPIGPTQEQHPHCLAVTHLRRHPQGGSSVLKDRMRSRVIKDRGKQTNTITGFKREN